MENFKEYIQEKKIISVFDVDDCLIHSSAKIRYKDPLSEEWHEATTREWAEIRQTLSEDAEVDYDDFQGFDNVYKTIANGKVNKNIFAELDNAVNRGDKIGILTARGDQRGVLFGLKSILEYKDPHGVLKPIPRTQLRKKYTFAVRDEATINSLNELTDLDLRILRNEYLKAFVLQEIFANRMGFEHIKFYDDDEVNIKVVQELEDPRIEAILI